MGFHLRRSGLLDRLRRGRFGAAALARAFGVGIRTIYRDMRRLEAEGFAVDSRLGPNGGFTLGEGPTIPIRLTEEDVVGLVLRLIGPDDTEAGLITRLREALSIPAQGRLKKLLSKVDARRAMAGPIDRALLARCVEGLLQRRMCRVHHHGPGQDWPDYYFVEPKSLSLRGGSWALTGWDRRKRRDVVLTLHDVDMVAVHYGASSGKPRSRPRSRPRRR